MTTQHTRKWTATSRGNSPDAAIGAILYSRDPMHLVDGDDTPEDEYESEARAVVAWWVAHPGASHIDLRVRIHAIFAERFAPLEVPDGPIYDEIAEAVAETLAAVERERKVGSD
jgi:hypothetical protein